MKVYKMGNRPRHSTQAELGNRQQNFALPITVSTVRNSISFKAIGFIFFNKHQNTSFFSYFFAILWINLHCWGIYICKNVFGIKTRSVFPPDLVRGKFLGTVRQAVNAKKEGGIFAAAYV